MKTYLIRNQILAAVSLASICGCSHGPVPKWDGELWAGDSKRGGIARAQTAEFIPAGDPRFDRFIAMSYSDFKRLYATYVLGCKEWFPGAQMMTEAEAVDRFKAVIQEMDAHDKP